MLRFWNRGIMTKIIAAKYPLCTGVIINAILLGTLNNDLILRKTIIVQ